MKENGNFKLIYLEKTQQYKVTISNEQENIEFVGDDSLKLTI
ncbi:hypothetical protein [Psychroflexus curvus]|nr:hypothetical protein [Psychroflexus curvus]